MATQPWVHIDELQGYSELTQIKNRGDLQLETDITRAEQYIISATNNTFADMEIIPPCIKIAVLLIAEAYAFNASISANDKKSETFDDYSYTSESKMIDLEQLDLHPLIVHYIVPTIKNPVNVKLRKL